MEDQKKKLLTAKEVCQILGITPTTLRRAQALGRIQGIKFVRRTYYKLADVQRIFG
jgi:predicted site-specific integrase-resolvase